MTWLRAIFARTSATPLVSSTAWGQTIQRMAAADDPEERARLGKLLSVQLEAQLSTSANNTLVALMEIQEEFRQTTGTTNEMIGEAVGLIRGQGAELSAARAEFRSGLSAIGERVTDVEGRVGRTEQRLDASERDRQQIRRDLTAIRTLLDMHIQWVEGLAAGAMSLETRKRYTDFLDQLIREREVGGDDAERS